MEQGISEELKERQRYWLDHLRAASAQGRPLARAVATREWRLALALAPSGLFAKSQTRRP
jgi:hypothetical protein